jgi:hypothetical protein
MLGQFPEERPRAFVPQRQRPTNEVLRQSIRMLSAPVIQPATAHSVCRTKAQRRLPVLPGAG